jgi:2-succinyl-5-enolpyruvyl-6-hydroxy-3-cyclohexene-1-carboxylate synthase
VEQEWLFGRATRWAVSPGVPDAAAASTWRSLGARIFAEARGAGGAPGPVHVNLAFREPLLGDPGSVDIPSGRPGGALWHEMVDSPAGGGIGAAADLLQTFAGGKGLVVAGSGAGEPGLLVEAAGALGWPVLADPRSGCRIGSEPVVASADALLRMSRIAKGWVPDVVVRAGAPWASKVVSQWLASLPVSIPQVLVDPWVRWADPERRTSHVVAARASDMLTVMSDACGVQPRSPWWSGWVDSERAAQSAFDGLLGPGCELELSEPAVARAVLAGAPAGTRVVVSSSMPIRDVEWFGPARCDCEVLSNRGANGIDGVLSTAVGVALAGMPSIALLGDLAFLYDAGALLGINGRDLSLDMIVIDNEGGGIFSFLPQASSLPHDRFERYWGTPQGADVLAIAGAYGVVASAVGSRAELDEFVAGAGKPGVRLAVVRSDRAANVVAHDRLNAAVADAVGRLV